MHLRMPSFDRGLTSGLWAIGLGLYVFVFAIAVDVHPGVAFIVSFVLGSAIYFFVRIYGEEPLR